MRVAYSPPQCGPRFSARLERLLTLPPRFPRDDVPTAPVVAGCWQLTTVAEMNALRGHILRWQHQLDAAHGVTEGVTAGGSAGSAGPSGQNTLIASLLSQIKAYKEHRDTRSEIWPYIVDFNHTEPLKHPDSLLGVAILNQRSNFLYALQAKPPAAIAADRQEPLKGVGKGLLYTLMKRLDALGELKPLILEPTIESLPFYRHLFGRPAKHFQPINRNFPDDPEHVDEVVVQTQGLKAFLKRHQAEYDATD